MKTTKPKTHEAITIRVTLAEAEAIRKLGRADRVVLRLVRASLTGGVADATPCEACARQAQRIEGMVEALAELPEAPQEEAAPQPKPTQINASTADMAASGLSKDFIYWLGNNCHSPFVLQLYKALESYGKGVAA